MKKQALIPVVLIVCLFAFVPFLYDFGAIKTRGHRFNSRPKSDNNSDRTKPFTQDSMYVTCQLGLKSYAATGAPFDTMPFPTRVGLEYIVAENIGLNGAVTYDKWCDYLGMFCGKFTFQVFQPSLSLTYHVDLKGVEGLSVIAGTSIGYNMLFVCNELCNEYPGNLKSGLELAPFLGTHFHFWRNISRFLSRLLVTFRVSWSVVGDFSGIYGAAGITFRIK